MKGDNLLIQEPPLQVLPSLAKTIGLNGAIFLQQLHYWSMNKKTEGMEKDGHKWVYNTYEDWKENFPFWSERTIQRIILDLENKGIILSEQFDKSRYERKKYYRIDYDKVSSLFETGCRVRDGQDGTIEDDNVARSLNESETTSETTNIEESFSSKERTLSKETQGKIKENIQWAVLSGEKVESLPDPSIKEALDCFERDFKFNPLPWSTNQPWTRLEKFVIKQYSSNKNIFKRYVDWRNGDGKFECMLNKQIYSNPDQFIATWPFSEVKPTPKPAPKVEEPENYVNMIEWKKEHRK